MSTFSRCHIESGISVADLGEGSWDAPPPRGGPISFNFYAVFWENMAKSYVGAPPGELTPPPWGNPGSATIFGLNKIMSATRNT